MAQSSSGAIGVDECKGITRTCGLTHLAIFGTFLSMLIRAAKSDQGVLNALKSLHYISYTGTAMNKEDEDWAHEHGIRVVVSPIFLSIVTVPTNGACPASSHHMQRQRPVRYN